VICRHRLWLSILGEQKAKVNTQGNVAVGYFEFRFLSNNHTNTPNPAKQIIPNHHGLNGIGIKNKTMSQNKRQPLMEAVSLPPALSGVSILI